MERPAVRRNKKAGSPVPREVSSSRLAHNLMVLEVAECMKTKLADPAEADERELSAGPALPVELADSHVSHRTDSCCAGTKGVAVAQSETVEEPGPVEEGSKGTH
jgi:hypothetical protein